MAKAKSANTGSQVVKKEAKKAVAVQDAFFDEEFTGFEDVNQDMLKIPFLKIAQVLSPQLKKSKGEYIKDLEAGQFFNTLTCNVFGESVRMVLLKVFQSFIEWKPNREGFAASYTPEEWAEKKNAENIEWDSAKGGFACENGNVVKDTRNHYIFLPDFPEQGPILWPMDGIACKASTAWISKGQFLKSPAGKKCPAYGVIWDVTAGEETNDKGDWYQAKSFEFESFSWDDENAAAIIEAKNFVKEIVGKQIDYAPAQDAQASPSTGDYEDIPL